MERGGVGGWTIPRVLGTRLPAEEEDVGEEVEEEADDEEDEEDEDEDDEGVGGLVSPQNQPKQPHSTIQGGNNQRLLNDASFNERTSAIEEAGGVAEPSISTDDCRRIVAVCVHTIPGAGIEVLITATRAGRLSIYAVEGGRQICAHDIEQHSSFLQDRPEAAVVALAAFDTQLYVATQTGVLLVIRLGSLLIDGLLFDKDMAGRFKRHFMAEFPLFPGILAVDVDSPPDSTDASSRVIASMACVAPRSFLGLRDEDAARILLKSRSAVTTATTQASNAQAHRASADARWDEVTHPTLSPLYIT